jgi:hypothetical protein
VIGDTQCIQITYKNLGPDAYKDSVYYIRGMELTSGKKGFKITSTSPKLPFLLKPADSFTVQLCFESRDTVEHFDTMIFSTDCFGAPVYLKGHNGTGILAASDFEFGEGVVDLAEYRGAIILRNLGSVPFTIDKKIVLPDTVNFSFEPGSISRFPYTLFPSNDTTHPHKDTMQVWINFHPKSGFGLDSATIFWNTDIRSPFEKQIKPWSKITGVGVKLGIQWDRDTKHDTTFKDRPLVRRVNLLSRAISAAAIDTVYFTGADVAEYSIIANKLKLNPLHDFSMNPGDTVWIDYTFAPNISKPEAVRYIDRHADLKAVYFINADRTKRDTAMIHMTGVVDSLESGVPIKTSNKPTRNSSIVKAYVQNNQIIVALNKSGTFDCNLYDLLGRKVSGWAKVNANELESGELGVTLALDKMASGVYVVHLESGSGEQYDAVVVVQ